MANSSAELFRNTRRIAEDQITLILTNYEEGIDDEQDLYELLCWIQNNWEHITGDTVEE